MLEQERIAFDLDLMQVKRAPSADNLSLRIRERENAGARFVVGRSADTITHVTIWTSEGRDRAERKIKLTAPQGKFLYHLPFPKADTLTVIKIMRKAGMDQELAPEILDLVQLLDKYHLIEQAPPGNG